PVHLRLSLRALPEGKRRTKLDGIPPQSDEGGRRRPCCEEREERQPEDQPHHQAAELVRAISVLWIQSRGAAEGVRYDLCRHRDARSGEHHHAPPAVPELWHHAVF